jgi:hypothetical protein
MAAFATLFINGNEEFFERVRIYRQDHWKWNGKGGQIAVEGELVSALVNLADSCHSIVLLFLSGCWID